MVDSTNLERNLYLTAQLAELGMPLVLALNVSDSARASGIRIDLARLSALFGRAPIVETVGHRGQGLERLMDAVLCLVDPTRPQLRLIA